MAQQIIAGGQTSALVTQELNDMFTELYNRTGVNYITHIGSEMINGITYQYRVWNNGFCEVWFTVTGTMPPTYSSANFPNIDSQSLYFYETPKVNYPTSIITFSSIPREICEVTAQIAVIKTTARSGAGYNSTTQSASYGLGRFDYTQLFGQQYKLSYYVCGQGTYVGS